MPEQAQPDFTVYDHFTICTVELHTDAAREWVEEHVPEYTPWGSNGMTVEKRFLWELVEGMLLGGLVSDQFEVAA